MQSSDGAAPVPPPRRPPRALSPSQARTTTASSTTTSMLRNRALARVNRIAAATGDYVAPKLESAAVSASTKLAHWRDRDRELQQRQAQSYATTTTTTAPVAAAGGPDGGYAYQVRQPKRAAAASSSSSSARALNPSTSDWYPSSSELAQGAPPYTRSMTTSSTAPSEAPSSTSTASSSRKWTTSGLGSYLNLSSYTAFGGGGTNVDADSVAATGGTGKGKGKAAAVGTDDIDEDKVLCFPGWATLEPSPHHDASEPALVLSIHAHGYAYRQRPLSQASRSQRIFYALAKSFAALPKIPPATAAARAALTPATAAALEAEEEVQDLEDKVQGLGIQGEEEEAPEEGGQGQGEGEEAIEKLLAVGGRAGDRAAEAELGHEAVAAAKGDSGVTTRQTYREPDEMTPGERAQSPTARDFAAAESTSSRSSPSTPARSQTSPAVASSRSGDPSPEESPILSTPAKLSRRPGFRIEIPSTTAAALKRSANSASQPGSPGASGTASPVRSPGLKSAAFNFVKRSGDKKAGSSSSATSSRASSRATSPVRNSGGRTRDTPTRSSTASTITSNSASGAAAATPGSLPPETWPAPFTLPSDPAALPRLHTNLHTRLLPFFGAKLANRKVRLSVLPALGEGQLYDGVLATRVVRTHATSGGGFRTRLEVKGPELKKWLELVGARGAASQGGTGSGTGVDALRVRVVAELLEPEAAVPSVVDTAPSFGASAGGASLGATASADKYATATAVDEIELDVAIQGDGGEGGGVRIVSDVDDTIKWTEVTKGTKTIFRNVFVRELPEIRVPGMATWYRQLQAHGAQFHYVSNSPVELWPVLRTFLKLSGFPNGSCTLKEYGGASSAIAKLWEEPGQRKKANVENILKEFPAARFILVGDSGEQDLELYVALARQYPANILAIYIRDVTTPFDPVAADPARRHSRERERARAVAAAAAESSQPGLPRRAGTDQLPPSSHESSSKRLSREPSLPPEITWRHRNSIHDLAGLIDDDALRFAAPEAFSPTMTSQRPSFEVERTLSDMPDLPGQWDGPHERPVPPRRSSDFELDDWASRAAPSASSGTATSPYTSSPAPLDSPSLMSEPDSDPLSPNNPIRPAPAGTAQDAAVEAFYRRVAAAEKGLPKGIILRLFRHGNECAEEALELVKTAGKRPFGT
ncbi:hypothetical protein BMF94_5441 [Rhodotorula taiwanensis]|uniref:Phosphatidate phosphatase APP1 catalytic domain-containing protein n=1 Tax=Rhodotorula taiwanensis TaxID=741276 RepID=A0A2S5B417_9BASI|nr:hypothetical protein BMF94_5441 [Rhodotorula taiwanensis]